MAKRVETKFVDDLDGSEADETVQFALGGSTYEIDLSDKNATAFYDAMAEYVNHARTVKVVKPRKVAAPVKRTNGRAPLAMTPQLRAEIRAWAQAHPDRVGGKKVGDRGKIADEVVTAYQNSLTS